MFHEGEDIFYYVTLYNENYEMPPMPEGSAEGIIKGLYRYREAEAGGTKVRLLGSGPILLQCLRAAEILKERYDVNSEIYSATSFGELRRDALACEKWNHENPGSEAKLPYVSTVLGGDDSPVIAATDFMKAVPELVGRWIDADFTCLGTDGYGRSDTREALRRFYGIDAESIAVAALEALARRGEAEPAQVDKARSELVASA